MSLISLLVVLIACFCNNVAHGQRNAEAEGMCQPFLTSEISSPLIPGTQRNLKIDEDGEYFCELVLQDRDLPGQVRVTIHEGLSFLAIRHVQMGLQRHGDVIRHLKILAQLVPTNFNFQFRAGLWSLDPMVAEPRDAVAFLRSALYGAASEDLSIEESTKLEARKHFAEALGYVGEFEEAQKELLLILKNYPFDFGVAFLLKETMHQLEALSVEVSATVVKEVKSALSPSEQLYASIAQNADIQYTGLKVSEDWTPQEFMGSMPPTSEFEAFITHREPFIVRSESHALNAVLNWTVDEWSNIDYLRDMVGVEEDVLVEKMIKKVKKTTAYGFGGGVHKRKMTFASFLNENFGSNANSDKDETQDVLNLSDGYFQDGIWGQSLSKLRADIPVPPCLTSREGNITSVNMWMSNAPEGSSLTSRMHMDPLDSLFVLVGGDARKTIRLLSPDQAASSAVQTISPTYGVSPDGFSFQYNSPADLPSLESTQLSGHEMGKGHYHFSSRLTADALSKGAGKLVQLSAGDILYIPAGWFYEMVTSSGPSVAVNYWWLPSHWRATVAQERQMKAALLKRLQKSQGDTAANTNANTEL